MDRRIVMAGGTALLALLVEGLFEWIERRVVPRGLRLPRGSSGW